jgi:ABC-type multidrug transport system ATPase subunit
MKNFPLVIKNLRKEYPSHAGRDSHVAVEDFSLILKNGEIFSLLGQNGAGKTSLISMLTGILPPD